MKIVGVLKLVVDSIFMELVVVFKGLLKFMEEVKVVVEVKI